MGNGIGRKLNDLIERSPFTIKELSQNSGVSAVTLWKMRKGNENFVYGNLKKVCANLGAKVELRITEPE